MNLRVFVLSAVAFAATLAPAAKAESIAAFSYQLTAADLTESGRPSRSSLPQDWTGTETYTGTVAGTYSYKVFTFAAALFTGAPYVDISTFDPVNGTSYFVTAYANSYNLANRGLNWLGDVGFSGNYQTNTGGDAQVVLPSGSDLVLVLNSTVTGVLPVYPFNIQVDAYADTMYSDPAPVPEPATWLMVGTGVLGSLGAARRRWLAAV